MALIDLLLGARTSGLPISALPAEHAPATLDDAYAVQTATITALGPIGAWKVGPLPAGGAPKCSPILARDVHPTGTSFATADLPGVEIEVEIAFKLATAFPHQSGSYSLDDARAAIGTVHIALELVGSRYTDRKAVPPLASIADLQSNAAVIVGPGLPLAGLPDFSALPMDMHFGTEEAGRIDGQQSTENALGALAWLARHAADRHLPLKPGDIIITGARLGPTPPTASHIVASSPVLGTVETTIA
jgi:2-keto-4-pentenoate hydratase